MNKRILGSFDLICPGLADSKKTLSQSDIVFVQNKRY